MSLIKCPACNHDVSESAFRCPSCAHQIRKPKRTLFGKGIKLLFIAFNLLMIWWLFAGLGGDAAVINGATTEAEKAGAALGTGVAMFMIGSIWVIGDIILGSIVYFTRPKTN